MQSQDTSRDVSRDQSQDNSLNCSRDESEMAAANLDLMPEYIPPQMNEISDAAAKRMSGIYNVAAPQSGMSYRQVFGIQSSDYLFNVSPPNYTRHRRFSDSDTESLHNFIHKIIPQDTDSKMKVLQQPKKWIKKVRRKSEDQPKRKAVLAELKQ